MQKTVQQIAGSARQITESHEFIEWSESHSLHAGDIIGLNNSYLHRVGRVSKSDRYLGLVVQEEGGLPVVPVVVDGVHFHTPFSQFRPGHGNAPAIVPLYDAIEVERESLGDLVFILIGVVQDTVRLSDPINHGLFDVLTLDPTISTDLTIQGREVTIRSTFDEERLWGLLVEEQTKLGHPVGQDSALRQAFEVSLDALAAGSYARLVFPSEIGTDTDCVLRSIVKVLEEELEAYGAALKKCHGDPDVDPYAFNEILRISYNFASDATTLIRLISNVCDLKPLLLWATLGEHYALSNALASLPWTRTATKPSLEAYARVIGDARNKAFHNLFPFRKTLEVELPTTALKNVSLRLFSEFGNKKTANELRYQDKELVDVLMQFTRARERRAPASFWRTNFEVMEATVALFAKVEAVLNHLYELRGAGAKSQDAVVVV